MTNYKVEANLMSSAEQRPSKKKHGLQIKIDKAGIYYGTSSMNARRQHIGTDMLVNMNF